jgi:hypothetical protein
MNPKKLNYKARHESGAMVRVSLWNAIEDGKKVGKVSLRFLDPEGLPLPFVRRELLEPWGAWIQAADASASAGSDWSMPVPVGWSFL